MSYEWDVPISGEQAPALPAPAPALPGEGDPIGEYVLERRLGAGGMGTVFVGRHGERGFRHALKLVALPPGDSTSKVQARFLREGQVLARLRHPGVVAVHQCEIVPPGVGVLSMDLIEGRDLARVLERAPNRCLPWRRALDLGAQVARALEHMHEHHLVHRDLKPPNVMLREDDGRAVLIDLGLVRDPSQGRLTLSGQLVGTPTYMSPEAVAGEPLESSADVYGLGATLYTLLCGDPPFQAERLTELASRILSADPLPLRARVPEIPAEVERLVLSCLSKEPARRPSAGELAERLERALAGASERSPRRALSVAVLLACAVGLAAALALFQRATRPVGPLGSSASVETSRSSGPASPASLQPRIEAALIEGDLGTARSLLARTSPLDAPRARAIVVALGGEEPDWSALTPADAPWLRLHASGRDLVRALDRPSERPASVVARTSLRQALALANDLIHLPPHPLLQPVVSSHLAQVAWEVLLCVPPAAFTDDQIEGQFEELAQVAAGLAPGDPRTDWCREATLRLTALIAVRAHPPAQLDLRAARALGPRWESLVCALLVIQSPRARPGGQILDPYPKGALTPAPRHGEAYLRMKARGQLGETYDVHLTELLRAHSPDRQTVLDLWHGTVAHHRAAVQLSETLALSNPRDSERCDLILVLLLGGLLEEARDHIPRLGSDRLDFATLFRAECAVQEGDHPAAQALLESLQLEDVSPKLHGLYMALYLTVGLDVPTPDLESGEPSYYLPWRMPTLIAIGRDPRRPLLEALGR